MITDVSIWIYIADYATYPVIIINLVDVHHSAHHGGLSFLRHVNSEHKGFILPEVPDKSFLPEEYSYTVM